MIENYPFTSCLHPLTVVNKHTGEKMKVGCGCCKACALQRAQKMSLLCSHEECDHRYCMFVTLTYSQSNVPTVVPSLLPDGDFDMVFTLPTYYSSKKKKFVQRVHPWNGVILYNVRYSIASMSVLCDKSRVCTRGIAVLNKYDLQCFIKRLRKRIYGETEEQIRYYAVGEYGPKTFRPHYHLMVFFDKDETLSCFRRHLRKAWKLGRVDASLSKHECGSYVAGYVNSLVNLPRVYADSTVKPFALHSQFFGVGFFKSKRKEIYSLENPEEFAPARFVYNCRNIFGKSVEFHPWRSLTLMFFPKCKGYSRKSYGELYYSYTIVQRARSVYGKDLTPYQLAHVIVDSGYNGAKNEIVSYFCLPPVSFLTEEEYDRIVASVYSELAVSNHFLSFCCVDASDYGSRLSALNWIIEFYKWKDYDNLKTMYLQEEILSVDSDFGVRPLVNFYDNFVFGDDSFDYWIKDSFDCFDDDLPLESDMLQNTSLYKRYFVDVQERYSKSIKHKNLNDLNKVFVELT